MVDLPPLLTACSLLAFGLSAISAIHEGDFGKMVALHGTNIARVPLASATTELKVVKPEFYAESEIFFG